MNDRLSRNVNTPSRIKRRIGVLLRELAYRERVNRLLLEEKRLMKALLALPVVTEEESNKK